MNKEQMITKMTARREADIREIFSTHGAEILLPLMEGVDVIIHNAFEGGNPEEAAAVIANVVAKMTPAQFNVIKAEMQEIDEGHTKPRIVRLVDAIMVSSMEVLEREWDNLPFEQRSELARVTMTKEQSDQLTKVENAGKRATAAKEEYDNLVKTMGQTHPYTLNAMEYMVKQITIFETEASVLMKMGV